MEKRRKGDLSERLIDYTKTAQELDVVKSEKEKIHKHYKDELNPHNELVSELKESDEYPFAKERDELIKAQENELSPLKLKEKSFVAKLRRLYTLDLDEAYAHNRYLEYSYMLPALREMLDDINKSKREMRGTRGYPDVAEIIVDAYGVIEEMRDLLSKETMSVYEEKNLNEKCAKLLELYGRISELEHRYVHGSRMRFKKK